MKRISSFSIDHDIHFPGIYLSSINEDIYTYDVRFCFPNKGYYLPQDDMHTIEHLLATVLRNHPIFSKSIVYVGPMGCRTGFYVLLRNIELSVAKELISSSLRDCLSFDNIPGGSREECGNFQEHNLSGAKQQISTFLSFIEEPHEFAAYIDIGSNSVRLELSLDGDLLKKEVISTRLADGLTPSNLLLKLERIAETQSVVGDFYKKAQSLNCTKIVAVATQALRVAKNSKAFLDPLKKQGVDVHIISSDEEAFIGFWGAYTRGTVAVLDVGGASVELVIGDSKGILFSHSFPFGVVTLTDKHKENIDAIKNECLSSLKKFKNIPSFDSFYVIGGSASVFSSIIHSFKSYDISLLDFSSFSLKELTSLTKKIITTDVLSRHETFPGLPKDRSSVIIASSSIISSFMQFLSVDTVVVREINSYKAYKMLFS